MLLLSSSGSARVQGLASAGVVLFGASAAHAVTYSTTNVGALIPGATSSVATSLNDADQIGGYYNNTGNGSVAFVYKPGVAGTAGTAMAVPGVGQGYTSLVGGINNAGLAVGIDQSTQNGFTYNVNTGVFTSVPKGTNYAVYLNSVNNSGMATGYLQAAPYYTPAATVYNTVTGTFTDVSVGFSGPATNGVRTPAYSINDSGQVVGTGPNKTSTSTAAVPFKATPNGTGGFTYLDLSTSIKAADPSFSFGSGAQYIDALGNVAGSYNGATRTGSSYLYNASTGTTTVLVPPSGFNSYSVEGLADVNGVPEVVGSRQAGNLSYLAFTYMNGVVTDISGLVPGYVLSDANAVNSKGDIVATGTPVGGGARQVFLLTVTPEPASLAALLAGPLFLSRRRRRA